MEWQYLFYVLISIFSFLFGYVMKGYNTKIQLYEYAVGKVCRQREENQKKIIELLEKIDKKYTEKSIGRNSKGQFTK